VGNIKNKLEAWIICRLFPDGFAYRSKQNASEELAVHYGSHEVS
jgi:hypothetical protein